MRMRPCSLSTMVPPSLIFSLGRGSYWGGALPQPPAAPSWGPLAGAGEREPPQNTTGLAVVCLCLRMAPRHTHAPRWECNGEGPCSYTEGLAALSPPQSFCLVSGPAATLMCRCNFPGVLGAAFLSSSLSTDGFSVPPVLPVLGWGRFPNSHHCMKCPSGRLIIIFVENILRF